MKIIKHDLERIEGCYSTTVMDMCDVKSVFFASEMDERCVAYNLPEFTKRKEIWGHPGGTMSMVAVPGRKNEFIAIMKFYRLWDWEQAELVWVKLVGEEYQVKELITIPYVHRFDCLTNENGEVYIIACSTASHKNSYEDWSCPGKVYAARLPDDLSGGLKMNVIREGLTQNHGYSRISWNGKQTGLVTCKEGGFLFTPPTNNNDDWIVEQILTQPTSDADAIDIDGDGVLEIATIEAFHGNKFRIYKLINGKYEMIFQHPEIVDFYHVVHAATIAGIPSFIGGGRGGRAKLFIIQKGEKNDFVVTDIDEEEGPSNVAIVNMQDYDFIFTANRNTGYATVYKIEP